jgi:ferredoxin
MDAEVQEIRVSPKAFHTLNRAKRESESLSDVILRLSSAALEGLQRRGEKEVVTSDGRRLVITVDQEKCLGAMSCVAEAPAVFAYDTTQKGDWRKSGTPLGMKDVEQGEVESEDLRLAAESCPYRAITLRDAETGDPVFP